MKKLVLLCSMFCLGAQVFAQDATIIPADQPKVRLGLRVTPTINWMGFDTQHFKSDGVRMGAKFGPARPRLQRGRLRAVAARIV